MAVFEELIEPKIVKILRLLTANPGKHYHLQKIASDAKVPIASTFRIVRRLAKLGYINSIVIGKFKIYKLAENKKAKELGVLLK